MIEREATRDHTERMLRHFGASVEVAPHGAYGRAVTLQGQPELRGSTVVVPCCGASGRWGTLAVAAGPSMVSAANVVAVMRIRADAFMVISLAGGRAGRGLWVTVAG